MTIIGQLERARGLGKYKVDVGVTAGPSSYSTGGFTLSTNLSRIEAIIVQVLGGGEYIAQVVDTLPKSGSSVTVKVRDNIEQAVDEGGTATYTIGAEVADGTDLSSVYFVYIAIGY